MLARWNLVGQRVELQANYYALLVVVVYWKEPVELDATGTVNFAAKTVIQSELLVKN